MKTTMINTLFGTLLLASFLITSCSKENGSLPGNNLYTISGDANGSQVVPATPGRGTATISGTYNPTSRLLSYTAGWSGLSGAPIAAGFYTGPTGVNGTVSGMPWSLGDASTGTGKISGSVHLTPEQASELTSGEWYYVFGTAAYPEGEVRGQISAVHP